MDGNQVDSRVLAAVENETSLQVSRKEYLNNYETFPKNVPTYFSNLNETIKQLASRQITESDIESLSMYLKVILSSDLINSSDYASVVGILCTAMDLDNEYFLTDVLRKGQLMAFIRTLIEKRKELFVFYFPGAVALDGSLLQSLIDSYATQDTVDADPTGKSETQP